MPAAVGIAGTCDDVVVAQVPRAVILLDRSGSMTIGGRDFNSRKAAEFGVANFIAEYGARGGEFTIREFSNAVPGKSRHLGPGEWISANSMTALADAMAAINGAIAPTSTTPLAQAICSSLVALRTRRQLFGPSAEVFFAVFSDGGENSSSGDCHGPNDDLADTGKCPADLHHAGPDFGGGIDPVSGLWAPSWQQLACANIADELSLCSASGSCTFLFNVYEFNDFAGDVPTEDEVFRALESLSSQTGGYVVEIQDGTPPVAVAPFSIDPVGCSTASGYSPLLQVQGLPRIGQTITASVSAPGMLSLVMAGVSTPVQPIPLSLYGSPGCVLAVDPTILDASNQFYVALPYSTPLVGLSFHMQGASLALAGGSLPPLMTTNVISATVSP